MKIVTRCFNSSKFDHVYLTLKIQSSVLQKVAETLDYSKALEIGIMDMISFDPLDSRNRPFRMKKIEFEEYE